MEVASRKLEPHKVKLGKLGGNSQGVVILNPPLTDSRFPLFYGATPAGSFRSHLSHCFPLSTMIPISNYNWKSLKLLMGTNPLYYLWSTLYFASVNHSKPTVL